MFSLLIFKDLKMIFLRIDYSSLDILSLLKRSSTEGAMIL